jgi:hypothetical protein
MSNPVDKPVNGAMDGPENGPKNGPENGPENGPVNSIDWTLPEIEPDQVSEDQTSEESPSERKPRPSRSMEEWAALRAEAQRRVRAGEKANRVAKDIGVTIGTFQHWQAEDGFRLIDLRHEAATGVRALPPAWVARHNGRRNNRQKLPLPEDYVQKIALQRELVMTREAQLRAARRVDPGVAGRVALGEAARLQREGDYDGAERAARLGERFLRMKARIDGVMDRWPGQAYKRQSLSPFAQPAVSADKAYSEKVKANLARLVERLEREKREKAEAAAKPPEDQDLSS